MGLLLAKASITVTLAYQFVFRALEIAAEPYRPFLSAPKNSRRLHIWLPDRASVTVEASCNEADIYLVLSLIFVQLCGREFTRQWLYAKRSTTL
jgi:hypothetical protein